MSLHPKTARWFETYVPREQTVYALEALAATGQVELEKDYVDTLDLRSRIAQSRKPIEHYAGLLPTTRGGSHLVTRSPEETARVALLEIRCWLA